MNQTVRAHNAFKPDDTVTLNLVFPNQCPRCGISLIPILGDVCFIIKDKPTRRYCTAAEFICTNCETVFLAEYEITNANTGSNNIHLRLFPSPSEKAAFSKAINTLSPQFCSIYNEAYTAEQNGLLQICGMGYRKSLEFLIKDFAIKNCPEESDAIKSKMLGKCIEDHIDSQRIKTLAKASSWLGNDETHYERRLEGYDLEHLKSFIKALVSFIDAELQVEIAEGLINPTHQ